jgi:hypothetical protein
MSVFSHFNLGAAVAHHAHRHKKTYATKIFETESLSDSTSRAN